MPARSVDAVFITNWQVTGVDVRIPQYQFDLRVQWTDTEGVAHEHTGTYRYPNDIAAMPLNVRRKHAEAMIVETVRVTLGINEWDDLV